MKNLVRSGLLFLALMVIGTSQTLTAISNHSAIPLMADDPKPGSGTGG